MKRFCLPLLQNLKYRCLLPNGTPLAVVLLLVVVVDGVGRGVMGL